MKCKIITFNSCDLFNFLIEPVSSQMNWPVGPGLDRKETFLIVSVSVGMGVRHGRTRGWGHYRRLGRQRRPGRSFRKYWRRRNGRRQLRNDWLRKALTLMVPLFRLRSENVEFGKEPHHFSDGVEQPFGRSPPRGSQTCIVR